jgi:hypothetical protein
MHDGVPDYFNRSVEQFWKPEYQEQFTGHNGSVL